jgi:hypothetical protein
MNGSKKETYEVTRNKRTRLYVRTILHYSSYTEQEPSSGTMVPLLMLKKLLEQIA